MTIRKHDPQELIQLALRLDLPDPEEHQGMTPEEVQRVSMAAMGALDALVETRKDGVAPPGPGSPDPWHFAGASGDAPARHDATLWLDDYVRLREMGYDWRVAAYIAWEASPKGSRWPGSVTDLATEVLGLKSPRVIYTWRKKNPDIDNVVSMMQSAPLYAHRRDVIEALVAVAMDPDYKAHKDRRLFFEMIGDYTPRKDVSLNDKRALKDDDLSALSDEELARRAAALKGSDAPEPPSDEGGTALEQLDAAQLDPPSHEGGTALEQLDAAQLDPPETEIASSALPPRNDTIMDDDPRLESGGSRD